MSGTAKIYDAELDPPKPEVAERYGAITEFEGTYRFVDPDGKIGIEIMVGFDQEDRLAQLPLVYSPDPVGEEAFLTNMEHSELGKRYVGEAPANEVAVREFIRVILAGDNGAEYSNESGPQMEVKGSGDLDVKVGEVTIRESTRQRASGTVLIDDQVRAFELRIPNLPRPAKSVGTGHTTAQFHLDGWLKDNPEDVRVLAELYWGDMEK